MEWVLFKYENGGNPYIAKTEKEMKRILKKYQGRIEKKEGYYFIKEEQKDKNAGILYPLF